MFYGVDVVLPVPLDQAFTYAIPLHYQACIAWGQRVLVPLGGRRVLTGIVVRVHHDEPEQESKDVLDVLDKKPVFTPQQLECLTWLARYYVCPLGQVIGQALPVELWISRRTRVCLMPGAAPKTWESPEERKLFKLMQQHGTLKYVEAAESVGTPEAYAALTALVRKRVIMVWSRGSGPKQTRQVRLAAYSHGEHAYQAVLATLSRRPKQKALLQTYWRSIPESHDATANWWLPKRTLMQQGASRAAYQALCKQGLLIERDHVAPQLCWPALGQRTPLPEIQKRLLDDLHRAWQHQSVVLMQRMDKHRVALYAALVHDHLDEGGQVLLLVPEIDLAVQMAAELAPLLEVGVGTYHAKCTSQQQRAVWHAVQQAKLRLVVGTRSALFLPFKSLKLLIVDRAHGRGYKQVQQAPYYHTRDAAVFWAHVHRAKVLLSTHTPSLETYYNAKNGKYGWIQPDPRDTALWPRVRLIRRPPWRHKSPQKALSPQLLTRLKQVLDSGKQAVIVHNKLGYAPYLTCADCGWVATCKQCTVSLTYYQTPHRVQCRYCGFTVSSVACCAACTSTKLRYKGLGIEQLVAWLQVQLPGAGVVCFGAPKHSQVGKEHQAAVAKRLHRADVFVGTPLHIKSLDFSRVGLLSVLDMDAFLQRPDFRAEEWCFQMFIHIMGQLMSSKVDHIQVVVQTSRPRQPVLDSIVRYDYGAMARQVMAERAMHAYPPYVRLIKVTLSHPELALVQKVAATLAAEMRQHGACQVLGPWVAAQVKTRGSHNLDLFCKLPKRLKAMHGVRKVLTGACPTLNKVHVQVDVDPN